MRQLRAYEEVIDFIAARTSPGMLVASRPSEATRERVADLLRREKDGGPLLGGDLGARALSAARAPDASHRGTRAAPPRG